MNGVVSSHRFPYSFHVVGVGTCYPRDSKKSSGIEGLKNVKKFNIFVKTQGQMENLDLRANTNFWFYNRVLQFLIKFAFLIEVEIQDGMRTIWTPVPGPTLSSTIVFYNFSLNGNF